jgi:hypothetical protein
MERPWINTRSGRKVNPLRLSADDIRIEDIAHSLSLVNRFAGHTREPISVAQHSVYVSRLCDISVAMQGLLHDAAEAYLGDVTKWLKHTPEFAFYREAEERVQRAIYDRFGCPTQMDTTVRAADDLMVRVEGEFAWGESWNHSPRYPRVTPLEHARVGDWEPWHWRRARWEFLERFKLFSNELVFHPDHDWGDW